MSFSPERTQGIVDELRPILGARIQRIDVIDVREIVLELRSPGRTLRLLVSARPSFGRVHLVDRRPARLVPGGSLQMTLRKRFLGRPLIGLDSVGAGVDLTVPGTTLALRFHSRKDAIAVVDDDRVQIDVETQEIPERFPENERAAAEYGVKDASSREQRLRLALLQPLLARRKKLERLRARVREDQEKLERLLPERHRAELLKSVLGQVKRGASSISVFDWLSNQTLSLELDPALDARRQMERWFQRAKRAERGLPRIAQRLLVVEADLSRATAEIEAIRSASMAELEGLGAKEVEPENLTRPAGAKPGPSTPLDKWSRRFLTIDGCEVRVGKGALENDRLTFAAAKGSDLWLHARGVRGSHVLLRRAKDEAIKQEALLDAAHLAVHYSDAKHEAKAEVVYTEARNVKKLKGAAPGLVSLSKEKTLWLEIEPARIERLLGRETK